MMLAYLAYISGDSAYRVTDLGSIYINGMV